MKKKYLKIGVALAAIFMLGMFFTACEKDNTSDNTEELNFKGSDPDFDPEIPSDPPVITSLFFTDVVLNLREPSYEEYPDEEYPSKYFNVHANWAIEGQEYVATVSAYAQVEDPDYPDNCYAIVQVMIIDPSGNIYGVFDSGEMRDDGDWEAEVGTSREWRFPASANLEGLSLVAQGVVWGCFADDPNLLHKIYWAEDERAEFNLPPIPPPAVPPSTPTNLQIVGSMVDLIWDQSTNADYYNIYRKQDYDKVWSLHGTSTSASYTDFSVITNPPESWFYYKVQAVNSAGVSGDSNTVSIQGTTYH